MIGRRKNRIHRFGQIFPDIVNRHNDRNQPGLLAFLLLFRLILFQFAHGFLFLLPSPCSKNASAPTVAVPFDRSSAVSQFPALRFPIFLLQPVLKPQNVPDLLTPDSTLCKILPQPRHHFRVKITFLTDFILL